MRENICKWYGWQLWCCRRLGSPLGSKEIKLVIPKGNQSLTFIGRADAETKTPILWPPDVKNWLIGKYPDAGKDWRQEKKGTTEDEMVGCNHWLDGHEFEQAWGFSDGRGSPLDRKESDMTEWLNWAELNSLHLCHLRSLYIYISIIYI